MEKEELHLLVLQMCHVPEGVGDDKIVFVRLQGKSLRTVMSNILDSVAAGIQADIPQLASDFQMGPANSVSRSSILPLSLFPLGLAGSEVPVATQDVKKKTTCVPG